jgi:hypothetical protein
MSRHNKVNKTNYNQGGRLTPDEMARERAASAKGMARQAGREDAVRDRGKERIRGKAGGRVASRPRSAPEE